MTATVMNLTRDSEIAPARRSQMAETGIPVEMGGARGNFRIATAGGKPGLEWAFLYEDDRHRFFFYAELHPIAQRNYEIIVRDASTDRLEGPTPLIPAADLSVIIQNIKTLFTRRTFTNIHREFSESDNRPQTIRFSWTVES